MDIGKYRFRLIDDWRRAHKFGSLQIGGALALLAEVLPVLADHWGEAAPYILKFFPGHDQAIGPFIGVVLMIAARLVIFEKREP